MTPLEEAAEGLDAGDLEFGAGAYPMYNEALRRFAAFYGTGFVQTVEAFVALSPNNDYIGNLRSLAAVLFAHRMGGGPMRVTTYSACADRALDYVRGDVSFLDTVKGKKITAFRHNVLYPETSRRVTVDGHMVAVWSGRDLTMKEAVPILRGRYAEVERDIARLARSRGVVPNALQAALWHLQDAARGVWS
jgi:hypothetical protein